MNRSLSQASVVGLLLSGCAVVSENVKYETRGGGYRGYMIDYVDADPTPGTLLPAGEKIRVTVTVRYVLQSSEKGLLVLLFRDEEGTLLELSDQPSMDIRRSRSTKTTLSREIDVPKGVRELWLDVQVVPDGERSPSGGLRIRYPVSAAASPTAEQRMKRTRCAFASVPRPLPLSAVFGGPVAA